MEKAIQIQNSGFLKFYAYSMCLYIFFKANILWLEKLPDTLVYTFICAVCLFKWLSDRLAIHRSTLHLSFALLVFTFYSYFFCNYGLMNQVAFFLSMSSVLFLSLDEKKYLLNAITNCLVIILLISIPVWILHLIGMPLPHSGIIYHPNGFHEYYDYYFFRLAAADSVLFPRFCSVFLEPGQLATPCAFLWFLNGANFSRKNIVLLVAIGLSFSLISYGLVMFGFVAARIISSKRRKVINTLLASAVVLSVSFYFSNSGTDNPISTLIVSRLEYDNEMGIVGNNRLSTEFRARYDSFISSRDKYWGIHAHLVKDYDWTKNSSGILKFVVHRGIIGFIIIMVFFWGLLFYNRSLANFMWIVILMAAFVVRDMLQTPLWCGLAIIGFFMLASNRQTKQPLSAKDSLATRDRMKDTLAIAIP